ELNVFKFHVDWTNPQTNSTFTGPTAIPTAAFNSVFTTCNNNDPSRGCVPQEGTAARLDAIADRIMYRLAYRNVGDHEALVLNHTVNIGPAGSDQAGVRWYELRKTPSPTTNWSIYQQGTYGGDATNVDYR